MNYKRVLVTGIVVFLAYMVMAVLVHGLWLGPTYSTLVGDVWRPQEELSANAWIMHSTTIVFSFIFAYLFARDTGEAGGGKGHGSALLRTSSLAFKRFLTRMPPIRFRSIWHSSGSCRAFR